MKHGHFWCTNCEADAGGTFCAACGRSAEWVESPAPVVLSAPEIESRKPVRKSKPVSLDRGHALFHEMRAKLNLP